MFGRRARESKVRKRVISLRKHNFDVKQDGNEDASAKRNFKSSRFRFQCKALAFRTDVKVLSDFEGERREKAISPRSK